MWSGTMSRVLLNGKAFTGWTISTYIKVTYNNSGDNTDFVTAMKNAGFPDSYIPNLTALHNKYPSWTFEDCKYRFELGYGD